MDIINRMKDLSINISREEKLVKVTIELLQFFLSDYGYCKVKVTMDFFLNKKEL